MNSRQSRLHTERQRLPSWRRPPLARVSTLALALLALLCSGSRARSVGLGAGANAYAKAGSMGFFPTLSLYIDRPRFLQELSAEFMWTEYEANGYTTEFRQTGLVYSLLFRVRSWPLYLGAAGGLSSAEHYRGYLGEDPSIGLPSWVTTGGEAGLYIAGPRIALVFGNAKVRCVVSDRFLVGFGQTHESKPDYVLVTRNSFAASVVFMFRSRKQVDE